MLEIARKITSEAEICDFGDGQASDNVEGLSVTQLDYFCTCILTRFQGQDELSGE
jgi:hypothetical protein